MVEIYEKYGYYREGLKSITLKGIDGVEKIQAIMEKLRSNPPKAFDDFKVEAVRDYKISKRFDIRTNEVTALELPVSNVCLLYTSRCV